MPLHFFMASYVIALWLKCLGCFRCFRFFPT